MLHIIQSNRMERLVDRLEERVREPLASPLTREVIVVQSRGMQRWLNLQLSSRLGIWANADYPFPGGFLASLTQQLLPQPESGERPPDPFDRACLRWLIMQRLPACAHMPGFDPPISYIRVDPDSKEIDERKCFQLTSRVAHIFDNYLVFRPEMIRSWDAGEHSHWQAQLWRKLCADYPHHPHRGKLREQLLSAIESGKDLNLPQRINIFGISSLPPWFLDIFAALSTRTDVNFFLLNPCREYWGEIRSQKTVLRQELAADNSDDFEDQHLEIGHPLLASMGRASRDLMVLVQDLTVPTLEVDDFESPEADSRLHVLQRDMLELRDPGDLTARPEFNLKPDSLRVHACYSPLREIEVLRDQLLDVLESHPDIQPRDIVVMAPDIEIYAPAIDRVFTGLLPFTVADRNSRRTNEIADAVLQLIALTRSRFGASDVIAMIENPAVCQRHGFDSDDLNRFRNWVRETYIQWGIDAEHRVRHGLPPTDRNTWRAGLRRMILGTAIAGEDRHLIRAPDPDHDLSILPYDEIEGGDARLLGRFAELLDLLFSFESDSRRLRSIGDWMTRLDFYTHQLLAENDSNTYDWKALRDAMQSAEQCAEVAGMARPVGIEVVEEYLKLVLDENRSSSPFLGAGVTFCSLLPMRSIPFRCVCLIGMNESDFPRRDIQLGFDLMARHSRRGDRSKREEDRQIFLEALLSARDVLILSYVGLNQNDGKKIPPSVLLSELLDLCGIQPTEHPLHAFSHRYFDGQQPALFSYSRADCESAEALWTHLHASGTEQPDRFQPLALLRLAGTAAPVDETANSTIDIPFDDFVRFFQNPTRYFLKDVLGLQLPHIEQEIASRNTVQLEPLPRYALRRQFFADKQDGLDFATSLELARARGQLPHGRVARPQIEATRRLVDRFDFELESLANHEPSRELPLKLGLNRYRLVGTLDPVYETRQIQQHFGRFRMKDQMALWLRHIAFNATDGDKRFSFAVGVESDQPRNFYFKSLPAEQALVELRDTYLPVFLEGHRRPLRFFPETSMLYLDKVDLCRKNSWKEDFALKLCLEAWANGFTPGEAERDPWYHYAFGLGDPTNEEFIRLANDLLEPLRQASTQKHDDWKKKKKKEGSDG